MAQLQYSDLAFSMLLSTQDMQRIPLARPPPYVQRSDGLVLVEDASYIAADHVSPPYVQRPDGLVLVEDAPYIAASVPPPDIGRQQPMLSRQMQRPHFPQPFPQYQDYPHPRPGSAASLHAHQANIPPRRRRANIPPRQRRIRASLHPFNNLPPPQLSDEEPQGLIEVVNPPAAEPAIIYLPSVVLSSDDDVADCVICIAELGAHERTTKLPCGHLFHVDCIVSWLNIKNTCPLCRFELHADEIHVQA